MQIKSWRISFKIILILIASFFLFMGLSIIGSARNCSGGCDMAPLGAFLGYLFITISLFFLSLILCFFEKTYKLSTFSKIIDTINIFGVLNLGLVAASILGDILYVIAFIFIVIGSYYFYFKKADKVAMFYRIVNIIGIFGVLNLGLVLVEILGDIIYIVIFIFIVFDIYYFFKEDKL